MKRLSDNEFIEELKRRFQENEKAFYDLRVMTKKLEKVNQKLQESEALKSNFLSNIKNEINNPLTSILGISEQIVYGENMDTEDIKKMAKLIHEEAFNLDFQLRNIFVAAELEAGESMISSSKVDMISLIMSSVDSFKNKAFEKNVEIVFDYVHSDLTEGMLHFKTDPEKIHVVLSNLLHNAIEFSQEGSKIEVKAWREDSYLKIYIKDYGIGIEEESIEAVFDRFKQVETGTTKTHRGHGLGLSITKAIVELLNGVVSVSSTKGKGSIFTILIPESLVEEETEAFSSDGNEFLFEEGELF